MPILRLAGKAPRRRRPVNSALGIAIARMRTIVVGTSGAGKSTFARQLASLRDVPYIELDSLFWGPSWTPVDPEVFRSSVARAASADAWVVDGNYSVVRSVLWPHATQIVWLNFSRTVVFGRIIRRTVSRVLTRKQLWAGNRETFSKAFLSRESILLWSFSTYGKNRIKYEGLRRAPENSHLAWQELRTPAQASALLHLEQSNA